MIDILRHGLHDEVFETAELWQQVCDDIERMIALYQEQ